MYIIIFYNNKLDILTEYLSLDYCPKLNDIIRINNDPLSVSTIKVVDYPHYESVVYYCEVVPVRITDMDVIRLEVTV